MKLYLAPRACPLAVVIVSREIQSRLVSGASVLVASAQFDGIDLCPTLALKLSKSRVGERT